jgi:hypothetical protein
MLLEPNTFSIRRSSAPQLMPSTSDHERLGSTALEHGHPNGQPPEQLDRRAGAAACLSG